MKQINSILNQSLGSQLIRSVIIVDPSAWQSSEDLVTRVEKIQSTKSLDEMFNLKKDQPQKIEIVKMTAFFSKCI